MKYLWRFCIFDYARVFSVWKSRREMVCLFYCPQAGLEMSWGGGASVKSGIIIHYIIMGFETPNLGPQEGKPEEDQALATQKNLSKQVEKGEDVEKPKGLLGQAIKAYMERYPNLAYTVEMGTSVAVEAAVEGGGMICANLNKTEESF